MTNTRLSFESPIASFETPLLQQPALEAQWPSVSVLVPCHNEEKHIAKCLDSILANDYPKERMEVLVVDGMSKDQTRGIVREYAERCTQVRLVDNPAKHIPAAMNVGIHNGRGDTIIKMDAHSTYQSDHIRLCVTYQEKSGAENVGGVWKMLPGAETGMARAIVLALGHRFGSGNARVKVGANQPTWSDSVAFGCFKKELFERIGFFDERLRGSSDMDMNMRIRAAGGRILLVPEIVVSYYADADMRAFRKHNFADGVWATYVLKFGSKGWSWRHWIPLAFVVSVLGSFALSLALPAFRWVAAGVLGAYVASNIGASLQIAIRERNLKYFFLLPPVFSTRHVVHGLGAVFGLVLVLLPGQHWRGRRGLKT